MITPIADAMFQSPSLRGSGRFLQHVHRLALDVLTVSIPFIAGQWSLQADLDGALRRLAAFQSPSLRGSGRFSRKSGRGGSIPFVVSIPFIAGQWSLQ